MENTYQVSKVEAEMTVGDPKKHSVVYEGDLIPSMYIPKSTLKMVDEDLSSLTKLKITIEKV